MRIRIRWLAVLLLLALLSAWLAFRGEKNAPPRAPAARSAIAPEPPSPAVSLPEKRPTLNELFRNRDYCSLLSLAEKSPGFEQRDELLDALWKNAGDAVIPVDPDSRALQEAFLAADIRGTLSALNKSSGWRAKALRGLFEAGMMVQAGRFTKGAFTDLADARASLAEAHRLDPTNGAIPLLQATLLRKSGTPDSEIRNFLFTELRSARSVEFPTQQPLRDLQVLGAGDLGLYVASSIPLMSIGGEDLMQVRSAMTELSRGDRDFARLIVSVIDLWTRERDLAEDLNPQFQPDLIWANALAHPLWETAYPSAAFPPRYTTAHLRALLDRDMERYPSARRDYAPFNPEGGAKACDSRFADAAQLDLDMFRERAAAFLREEPKR